MTSYAISINGQVIPYEKTHRFLGIIIDNQRKSVLWYANLLRLRGTVLVQKCDVPFAERKRQGAIIKKSS